jgi:4'-phosphopantetheinyl transferase
MRTKGSKPFLANLPNPRPPGIPNFNFNVSHEGSFVALAAEPVCICGVDVAAPYQLRPGSKEASGLSSTPM